MSNQQTQTNKYNMDRQIKTSYKGIASQSKRIFMKHLLCLFSILFIAVTSLAQSYLGSITKQTNIREGSGKDYNVIGSLKPGAKIFIVSLETENDFYNIIDIKTNKEGYVHKSFVKIGKQVKENDQGIFSPSGETESYNPDIHVYNNTSLSMTLKLGNEIYSFSPKEKKVISVTPGTISFRASAPGVTPYIGTDVLKSNQGYSWEFYIITRYK